VTHIEKLACQRREGEHIAEEQFFYDPAQLVPKSQDWPAEATSSDPDVVVSTFGVMFTPDKEKAFPANIWRSSSPSSNADGVCVIC
jgi:hypothetical protein